MNAPRAPGTQEEYDYIIVGSGAGGAPLAARLARARKRVLVIEAGSNQGALPASDPDHEVTRVPGFHGLSTEHEAVSWRFFVDHYERCNGALPEEINEDPKWHVHSEAKGEDVTHDGIFYPRATGVGGCTIHNAMITIAGADADWDDLADLLGDESWRGERMRAYFQDLEDNSYTQSPRPGPAKKLAHLGLYAWNSLRWLFGFPPDSTSGQHGFGGWLGTSVADVELGLADKQLVRMLKAALRQSRRVGLERAWTLVRRFVKGQITQSLDPNHRWTQLNSPEGVVLIPLSVYGPNTTIHQDASAPYTMRGRRSSPRELLLGTLATHSEFLTIKTNCLVTKVLLDQQRAVGVEYLEGERLYRAHVNPSEATPEKQEVRVKPGGEVILCGGAFNTPQLLMLSGIGAKAELEDPTIGIACVVDLPGVGRNLQDRYEVSVVSQMANPFSLLRGATFRLPTQQQKADSHLAEWRKWGTGIYATNGAVMGIFKRSRPDLAQPDLFIFGLPADFRGYKVGYSELDPQSGLFSWVILKSNTTNRDGRVRLRDKDPRSTPLINFHYFNQQSRPNQSASDPDLLALVEGVKFVREIGRLAKVREEHPGESLVPIGSSERMKTWIRSQAWGHHACGTCRMGPPGDANAVLDSRFRVRGVEGLRVVDASIFPKIPGYFIVTNIYMASEKAAQVILEDAACKQSDSTTYPEELRDREAQAIMQRRGALPDDAEARLGDRIGSLTGGPGGGWHDSVTGLALSGGGIRSATLSLGILQNLARNKLIRKVDFLSTVSGGGYLGACLGRAYDRLRTPPPGPAGALGMPVASRVEQEFADSDSWTIDWLRRHGNYIAPQGQGDGQTNAAVFVRNLLSIHVVVGLAIFSLFGVSLAVRFGVLEKIYALWGLTISTNDLPIGHLVESWLGAFFSPWFALVELLILFLVVPRIVAYWIVSEDQHETYKGISVVIMFFVVAVLLWLTVCDGLAVEPLFLALALLSSFVHVELAWHRGHNREEALGTGGVETQRLRTRNYLTYDLGLSLALVVAATVFAAIDTLAFGLQEWKVRGNRSYAEVFAGLGAAILAVTPAVRYVAGLLASTEAGPSSTVRRLLLRGMSLGLLGVVLFTLPLLLYAFSAHAVYQGGTTLAIGLWVTLFAVALTLALALPKAISFVNRSSLSQVYAARLARAYLGASNPLRHRPEGISVTEVIPGDDVASIRDYRPFETSGPLHLINVIVNQTVDFGSLLRKRDRQGENLAVSCLAMSIGTEWHSAWEDSITAAPSPARKVPTRLVPLGHPRGIPHPLVDQLDEPADQAEMLSLRQWISISGGAIDPGRGSVTNLSTALLMGLVNLRTGHWWDSGISHADRLGFPDLSFTRRLLYLVPRLFATQSLILFEWLARFPGPWCRYWHLSDGGFFENTGAYELIRRRVPRIIVCDGSADPRYQFESLADLARKVRIDFRAQIKPYSRDELDALSLAGVLTSTERDALGTEEELKPPTAPDGRITGPSPRHAALYHIEYEDKPDDRGALLYLKASLTGDESTDVRQYHHAHPEFPHEATVDQFFDEPQWESYRKLGEHMSAPLFKTDWFWRIPI